MNKKTKNNSQQIPTGFKQTDIGLIPEDWELKKLSEASEIIMGQSPPSSTYNSEGNGLPFYQGKADFGNVYPTPRIWCTSPAKIAEKNDILISVRAPVGPTNLSFEKSGIGRGLSAIRTRENHYLYLYYYLNKIEKVIEKLGTGSTFKAINKSQLYNIEIPLPPLPEQKKIAYVLSKIQQAIEVQEKIIKTTQELKKALMQKLFTEGLYGEPQKQTEIGPIPESWEVKEMSEITKITSGGTPSRKIPKYYTGENLWVKSGELEDNIIEDTEEKITDEAIANSSAKIFPQDTILIAMYGATVGKTAILKKKSTTNQAVCAILPNYDLFDPEFLRHYFITIRDKFLSQRYGGAQPNISQTIIKNTKVPIPSITEQKEISKIFKNLDLKIVLQNNHLSILKEFFHTTLNQLMTGQIRVKDIEFKIEETQLSLLEKGQRDV
ncbi:MAG: hypothetical protein KatS3mg036_1054 [Ignavibacterium sp.]|uniref:restriction endonuclease subunit S n=1 Tax=Ignavibacterium sp. TaxID=2651167 RepID=UPI0021DD3F06|nr:restriction endonuclease subunit S [Ignavibacterium sp.]BDQ02087.1 MAG: hypothetical protein KatS3mg037_0662 [Ignavibacterium sp.]GIV46236.1 MAG: hypothetical protein KatS3mg036_1054 [Ignavibacterium sp.]